MLKIKTTNDKLLGPLQRVTGIVERRHTLPILSNVLISAAGGKVDFLATDLEVQITATAQLEGLDPGRARMSAHLPAAGWLVWSQAYDSGWRVVATGSGGPLNLRPAPAWGAVMAVPLPGGDWSLRWTYRPDAVNWGAILSLLTAVLVFGRIPRAKEPPVSDFAASSAAPPPA